MTELTEQNLKAYIIGLLAGVVDQSYDLSSIADEILQLRKKFNNTGDMRKAVLGYFIIYCDRSISLSQADEVARRISLKLI